MGDSKKVKEKVKKAVKNDTDVKSAYKVILGLCNRTQANK
jgi:hypothetical protein